MVLILDTLTLFLEIQNFSASLRRLYVNFLTVLEVIHSRTTGLMNEIRRVGYIMRSEQSLQTRRDARCY